MDILAKASLTREQISVKKNIGCDGIEIQLLSELLWQSKLGRYRNIHEAFDLDSFRNEPIRVVHAPIFTNVGDMTIEQMSDVEDYALFQAVCELANYFGSIHGREIIVVVHSETFVEFISGLGGTLARIERTLDKVLGMYPYVKVCIENVTPLRNMNDERIHLSNNFDVDNIKLVKCIRSDLKTTRVGTVLDTCHAMVSEKYLRAIYNETGDRECPDMSMEHYFSSNVELVSLIHLADIKGSGCGKGRHGVPFTQDTKQKCFDILDLYHKYNYTCPITLEVEEQDFSICDGYRSTKMIVDEYNERMR